MVTYFTFVRPELLWLLFTVPLLVFAHLYFMHHARRKAILFGNFKTLERITGKKILTKNILLLIVRILMLACLVFSVAGTTLWRSGDRTDNDVVLVIDASASMTVTDMGAARIDVAKDAAGSFVDTLDASMRIGVVQYSGLSTVVTEMTTDRGEVRRGIDGIAIRPLGGSDVAGAIVTGANLLSSSEGGRVVVLLSDGVAALSLYDDNPIPQAIEYARDRGIVIHTIGIGTQQAGSLIPTLEAQAALFDEQNLMTIANSTGGSYTWARDTAQVSGAFSRISEARREAVIPTPLSEVLLVIVVIVFFIEWGLINTRYRMLP